tara:strand:+ start:383 stop:520 length:138 start_codon:yes stop_codon:yes gene_type:complete
MGIDVVCQKIDADLLAFVEKIFLKREDTSETVKTLKKSGNILRSL